MTSLQTFTFLVRDATAGSHEVTFIRHSAGHLSAECTCQKGLDADRCCEHCLRLLTGDATDLVSDNALELEVLEWWLTCMDLKQTISRVQADQDEGRVPSANASSVFAFWPDLTAEDFSFEHRDGRAELGAA
ncbi:MAG: hypothetical protein WD995_10375 [Gemmatimonadota bacterium]